MPQLISIDECEQLTARRVHDLYRKYVSRSQVSLMTSFGFGRELVERAEGARDEPLGNPEQTRNALI